ncbi:MAG: tRNA (adenosine(37)-N6)-threonylcarbamoyltransferase complex dimerization subunit type 1 TsaB [Pirellulales bacterium]|nr:tRNA (adenosine(37)-N6)-threonylcarbamoyltransferase complex dimerization subunit type 1 TsaB [Pirellulales bacterium]
MTRLLALETSGRAGSVAALEGDKLLAERALDPARGSAATLAPAIQDLLTAVNWRPADAQVVAVATGPGSFTGLRIGVMTAKTLAYALGAEVVGVDTLDVIAWQAPRAARPLWTVLDAGREQLFVAHYVAAAENLPQPDRATRLVDAGSWLAALRAGDWLAGPALERCAPRLPTGVHVVESAASWPTAGAVGQLAWSQYLAGVRHDFWNLTPNYFRPSAAEERRP